MTTGTASTSTYIWYGNWSGNTATTILTDFAEQHRRLAVLQHQHHVLRRGEPTSINGMVTSRASTNDNYSQGTVADATRRSRRSSRTPSPAARCPKDTNARLLRPDLGGRQRDLGLLHPVLRLAHPRHDLRRRHQVLASSATRTAARRRARPRPTSPNGNAGADGMASIIAHELEEAATDPDLNAWYDATGAENADKCAWTFGTEYTAANGSQGQHEARPARLPHPAELDPVGGRQVRPAPVI